VKRLTAAVQHRAINFLTAPPGPAIVRAMTAHTWINCPILIIGG
jgi:hypothetical protein